MKKTIWILLITIAAIFLATLFPENRREIKSIHFTFKFNNAIDTATILKLLVALENNYLRIANDLGIKPASLIEVNIYNQRWRYIKATKNWGGSGNIEGVSKLYFMQQAWEENDSKKIAIHEFAHTVTLKLLIEHEPQPLDRKTFDKKFSIFPIWLWEGVSTYEAQQFVDPKTLPYLTNGKHPKLDELNSRLKGAKIYTCGYTIIEFILSKFGRSKLIDLIVHYGDIKTILNLTDEQFCNDWYEFVQKKYFIYQPIT